MAAGHPSATSSSRAIGTLSALADLTDEEAAALGRLRVRLAHALRTTLEADNVLSFVIGLRIPHFHEHLVTRHRGTPGDISWDRSHEAAPKADDQEVAALCVRSPGSSTRAEVEERCGPRRCDWRCSRPSRTAFDEHDLDGIMAHFADDAVFEGPRGADSWGSRFVGREAIREAFAARFAGIPDIRYQHDEHFVDGDRGASSGPCPAPPPRDRRSRSEAVTSGPSAMARS